MAVSFRPMEPNEESPRIRKIFSIDVRSLALFRISIGAIILANLALRLPDLSAHYTNAGVLPRWPILRSLSQGRPSLHLISGSAWGQAILFALTGLAAVALTVGYYSRAATVVCWVLLVSLINRNPYVTNHGDLVLTLLLFWSMFLPLGATWSFDERLKRETASFAPPEAPVPKHPPQQQVFSVASAAILLQVAIIYWFTGLLKTGPEWRVDYTAVWYSLQLSFFQTSLAEPFSRMPGVLKVLTASTLYVELFGPMLAFSPVRNAWGRMAAVFLFVSLHLGFMLFLHLQFFSPVCIAAWLVFLPSNVWTFVHTRKWRQSGATRTLEASPVTNAFCGIAFCYVILFNAHSLNSSSIDGLLPKGWAFPGRFLKIDQKWIMFAPRPLPHDYWLVLPAKTNEGETVDLLRGGDPVEWPNPGRHFWRRVTFRHGHLLFSFYDTIRKQPDHKRADQRTLLGQRLVLNAVDEWNRAQPIQNCITAAALYVVREQNNPTSPPSPIEKWLVTSSNGAQLEPDATKIPDFTELSLP